LYYCDVLVVVCVNCLVLMGNYLDVYVLLEMIL